MREAYNDGAISASSRIAGLRYWIASALVSDAVRREMGSVEAVLQVSKEEGVGARQIRDESLEAGKLARDALIDAPEGDRTSLMAGIIRLCEITGLALGRMVKRLRGGEEGNRISGENLSRLRTGVIALSVIALFLCNTPSLCGASLSPCSAAIEEARSITLRDQGSQPSCTAYAVAAAMEKALGHQLPFDLPGRLWPLIAPEKDRKTGGNLDRVASSMISITGAPLKLTPISNSGIREAVLSGQPVVCGVPEKRAFDIIYNNSPMAGASVRDTGRGHAITLLRFIPEQERYVVYDPNSGNTVTVDAALIEPFVVGKPLTMEIIPGVHDPTASPYLMSTLDRLGEDIRHARTDADSIYGRILSAVGDLERVILEDLTEKRSVRTTLENGMKKVVGALDAAGAANSRGVGSFVQNGVRSAKKSDVSGVANALSGIRGWVTDNQSTIINNTSISALAGRRKNVLEAEVTRLVKGQTKYGPDVETAREIYHVLDALSVHAEGALETYHIREMMGIQSRIFESIKRGDRGSAESMALELDTGMAKNTLDNQALTRD